jgi:hypothetical protein
MIGAHMQDTKWRQLCEAIMREQDPNQLLSLVEQLNQELELREKELKHRNGNTAIVADGNRAIVAD